MPTRGAPLPRVALSAQSRRSRPELHTHVADARHAFSVRSGAILSFKLPKDSLDGGSVGAKERLFTLIASLRVFRILIAIWNIFVIFLMIVWFP